MKGKARVFSREITKVQRDGGLLKRILMGIHDKMMRLNEAWTRCQERKGVWLGC